MSIHAAVVPAIEAWLRAGAGDDMMVHEPIEFVIPDRLDPVPASVALPPARRVRRLGVRLDGGERGWTLWIGVDDETGEPVAVTHVPGWVTW